MLPQEINESFDLVKIEEKKEDGEKLLHLYLDEFEIAPDLRVYESLQQGKIHQGVGRQTPESMFQLSA